MNDGVAAEDSLTVAAGDEDADELNDSVPVGVVERVAYADGGSVRVDVNDDE